MRLIDADELQSQLERKKSEVGKVRYIEGFNDALLRFKSMVSKAPTIKPRYGEWIYSERIYNPYVVCSACGKEWNPQDNEVDRFLFCPNCGADMRKSK